MKRPMTVWFITTLVNLNILGIIFEWIGLFSKFSNMTAVATFSRIWNIHQTKVIYMFIAPVVVIITTIMIYKFFMLQISVIPWVYATAATGIIANILLKAYIFSIVELVFAVIVIYYIKNAKMEGRLVFS